MDSLSSAPSPNVSRDVILRAIRDKSAQEQLSELLKRMHTVCFTHCVTLPSTSLSSKEQTCINQCMEKYMDMRTAVGKQWNTAVQKERANTTISTGAGSGSGNGNGGFFG